MRPARWQWLSYRIQQTTGATALCLSLRTESEAGVVGAGPEGAGPQRTPVTFHLPRAAPRPAQRL